MSDIIDTQKHIQAK
jgi:hypothetical protein